MNRVKCLLVINRGDQPIALLRSGLSRAGTRPPRLPPAFMDMLSHPLISPLHHVSISLRHISIQPNNRTNYTALQPHLTKSSRPISTPQFTPRSGPRTQARPIPPPNTMASPTVPMGVYLWKRLASLGIEHVFGVPGDFNCKECNIKARDVADSPFSDSPGPDI